MVEGARLESVYTVKRIKGSNPFLSAKPEKPLLRGFFYVSKLESTTWLFDTLINNVSNSLKSLIKR